MNTTKQLLEWKQDILLTFTSFEFLTIRLNVDQLSMIRWFSLALKPEGRSVDKSIFALESIKFTEYSSCLECGFPMTSPICMIRHDKEAQKLDGDWIIFHRIEKNGYIKLFFQRNRLTFGTVAQPRDFITLSWLYNKFKDLKEGDKVIARGWRYKTRTSLSFIEKIK